MTDVDNEPSLPDHKNVCIKVHAFESTSLKVERICVNDRDFYLQYVDVELGTWHSIKCISAMLFIHIIGVYYRWIMGLPFNATQIKNRHVCTDYRYDTNMYVVCVIELFILVISLPT